MLNAHTLISILALFLGQLLFHVDLWEIVDSEVEIHDGVQFLPCADEVERGVVRIHALKIGKACQLVPCLC